MEIAEHRGEITPELMELLLVADPDLNAVEEYVRHSRLLVVREERRYIAVAVLSLNEGICELKNISVLKEHEGKGIGKQLLNGVKVLAKSLGAQIVEVGTGNSSLAQLAFYQKSGFRMHRIESDFFLTYPEPIFENGIRCLDMVFLRSQL